jgi:hypothetical protein
MGPPLKKGIEEERGVQAKSQATPHVHTDDQKSQSYHDGATQDARLEVPIGVIEQRVSNLAQGALCLVLLTGPFLHVLHLIPRGTYYNYCLLRM